MKITIDASLCKTCLACIDVCPNKIYRKTENKTIDIISDRTHLCISCGQCMAVCNSKAVHVEGLLYERDFFDFTDKSPVSESEFIKLIKTRRSIRSFKNIPIPNEMLEKIVDAVRFAPPSFPPIKTEIVVINNKQIIKDSVPEMARLYDFLVGAVKKPFMRFFVKQKAGDEKFRLLINHVVPLMTPRLNDLKLGIDDGITHNAPAMLIFHANKLSDNFKPDIYIAVTYAMLAAHSLGLGATIIDLIPNAIEKSKLLRQKFLIPEQNEVVASLIVGFPKHTYKRGISRKLKDIKWI